MKEMHTRLTDVRFELPSVNMCREWFHFPSDILLTSLMNDDETLLK